MKFEVKSILEMYPEVSLRGAAAISVRYSGKKAIVQQIIEKAEFGHRTVASFETLMHNFYKLQQGRNDKAKGHEKTRGGFRCSTWRLSWQNQ